MRIGPPATEQERAEALACLLRVDGDSGGSERLCEGIALAESGEIDLGGLVAVWQEGRAVCAALFGLSPDGSAFVWPPEVRAGGRHEDAVAVLGEIAAQVDLSGCLFAQAIVEQDRPDHRAALEAAGFPYLTDLLYLQRPLGVPSPQPGAVAHRLVPYSDASAARFAAVIERTFTDSHDCPGFTGIRSAANALRSYRCAGDFTPQRWRLVERGPEDVAVILVNDRPEERAREIIYFGVVPEARRQGLGQELVATALHEARDAGLDCVVAAVDASNAPALDLYSRLGFLPASRRALFLRRGHR